MVELNCIYRVEGMFSASHSLPGHPKCSKLHGHNYKVELFVKMRNSFESEELVVDLSALKGILRDVLEIYDHTHLNDKISQPSCENVALSIANDIKTKGITPYKVRVWETPLQWVEVIFEE
jgi:6-pyruvoyltetrahydropterin/6-carboxytetrahydropterin synthase